MYLRIHHLPGVERFHLHPLARHHRDLPRFEEDHLTGVLEDGRNIGGHVHLTITDADNDATGVANPRGDDLIRLQRGHNDHAVRAAQVGQRQAHRLGQPALHRIAALDQVDDGFGVGLRCEHRALGGKFFAQLEEVLHDAVMHHYKFSIGAGVRVRVAGVRLAVRGPARMPDAHVALYRSAVDQLRQFIELARVFADLDMAVGKHRQPGRVIAAVFQPPQAVEDNRGCVLFADVSYDSTHDQFSLCNYSAWY